ncbi:MAG: aminotransferase class I/II-fold pyridoxal phosphate-dependent enzyme [Butyricicoccus sp.]
MRLHLDGAKSDRQHPRHFGTDNTVLVPTRFTRFTLIPTLWRAARSYSLTQTRQTVLPLPDESVQCDIIYLLSEQPTGAAYDRAGLKAWVDYANKQNAVILYDAAYECFIEDETLPRSIYEIEGAKSCAIEFCSFSKMAGFTGTRCGWTVVPTALLDGKLNKMWLRRQTTKFNGVPYNARRLPASPRKA